MNCIIANMKWIMMEMLFIGYRIGVRRAQATA